ncbi:hypothetical protein HanRHA438_Chr06g0262121 [Helianthus annuus]|nr:hypothetical protein HanRHA438_Chr06g0262121 [Helianthus annuus]
MMSSRKRWFIMDLHNQEMGLANLDDEQKTIKKHGAACDEVRKVERSNKRSKALRNWKWDEVIEIVSSDDDWEEDIVRVIKRSKFASLHGGKRVVLDWEEDDI